MIAEDDFVILKTNQQTNQGYTTVPGTWWGFERSTEPEFKSKPQRPYYKTRPDKPFEDLFEEMFGRGRKRPSTNGPYYNPYEPGDVRNLKCKICHLHKDTVFVGLETDFICSVCTNLYQTNQGYHPSDAKYYDRKRERGFGNEKQPLKCKTCGQVKLTLFMGLPELFECNFCQWTAFEKEKE